mgnify:CR=1 FL=1
MEQFRINQELFRAIPADVMLRYGFVPYRRDGKSLVIVVSDPTDLPMIDELSVILGTPVRVMDHLEDVAQKRQAVDERRVDLERQAKLLDARVLIDIINASSGRNSASQDKFPRTILPGTFDFGFATGLSYKDVRLCVDEAETMGVPMVVGAAVRQMLAVTKARFGADSDFTHVAKLLEEWAGVEIRG